MKIRRAIPLPRKGDSEWDGLVIAFAITALLVGILAVGLPRHAAAGDHLQPPFSHNVVSGDSLWTIARTYYDKNLYDTRAVVWAIRRANPNLDPSTLIPNQDVVRLPRLEEIP